MEECDTDTKKEIVNFVWRGPFHTDTQQIKNKKKYMFVVPYTLSNAFFKNPHSHEEHEITDTDFSSFVFYSYMSTSNNGQSVMISFKKDGLSYIICSTGDENLHFKQLEPPPRVSGRNCDFIFYLNNALDGFSTLQIADGTDRYLSYNENNVAILKKVAANGRDVDETIMMHLVDK